MVKAQTNQGTEKVTTVQADFSTTDDRRGGRSAHVPPGDYLLEVVNAEVVPVKSKPGKMQVLWDLKIVAGAAGIGQMLRYYTGLDATATGGLWQLRNLISDLAGGIDIPKSKANIDLAKKVGQRVGATLIDDDPYEPVNEDGTPKLNPDGSQVVIYKSVISLTFPADKFVGPAPAHPAATTQPAPQVVAPPAPTAPVAQPNGVDPVAAAAAIAAPAPEDADIPALPIASL